MMEIANDGAEADESRWAKTWSDSSEAAAVKSECHRLKTLLSGAPNSDENSNNDKIRPTEFATSFLTQLLTVTKRAFMHDWRSPTYLYSKALTTFGCVGLVSNPSEHIC
jgi:ATP-binding cassette subfamily G (WHITE) protein 2 (PDR)